MTVADHVVEILAGSECALIGRIAALQAELLAYREVGQQAIHALHHLTCRHDRLREQHRRVVDELRELRARIMKVDAA